jgi:hypothetical protein
MYLEGSDRSLIEILFWNRRGGTERDPRSEQPVYQPTSNRARTATPTCSVYRAIYSLFCVKLLIFLSVYALNSLRLLEGILQYSSTLFL